MVISRAKTKAPTGTGTGTGTGAGAGSGDTLHGRQLAVPRDTLHIPRTWVVTGRMAGRKAGRYCRQAGSNVATCMRDNSRLDP